MNSLPGPSGGDPGAGECRSAPNFAASFTTTAWCPWDRLVWCPTISGPRVVAAPPRGRGFHYQDAVATELAVRAWRGELSLSRLIPEGLEDISLELETNWLHLQAKSRTDKRRQE